jgi:hypothetical protein
LRDELLRALYGLVAYHSAGGVYYEAIESARRSIQLDPFHEPAHRRLMQKYARVGQRAGALPQYRECVQTLERELGIASSAETNALNVGVRSGALGPPSARLPLREEQIPLPRHNLPVQPTPLIGREQELAELDAIIADPDTRLVSVVGIGGIGKTRLALQAAGHALDRFADGAGRTTRSMQLRTHRE